MWERLTTSFLWPHESFIAKLFQEVPFFVFFRCSLGSLDKVTLNRMVTERPNKTHLMTEGFWFRVRRLCLGKPIFISPGRQGLVILSSPSPETTSMLTLGKGSANHSFT